jgi:DNA-binding transcriptional ArsR family regulator
MTSLTRIPNQPGAGGDADLAAVGSLFGDRTRAQILLALDDGRARSAGELGALTGVTKATVSAHLARLVDGGLLTGESSGRHRYFRLAGPSVAAAIEAMLGLAPTQPVRSLRGARVAAGMRYARLCYDHLAGQVGVGLTDAMIARGQISDTGGGYLITEAGAELLAGFGIDVAELRRSRRNFARGCQDWTERTPHLAGALGAAIATRMIERDWLIRRPHDRVLTLSQLGSSGLRDTFGVAL